MGVKEGKGSDGSSSNSALVVCTGGALGSGHVFAGFGMQDSTLVCAVLESAVSFNGLVGVRRGVVAFFKENDLSFVKPPRLVLSFKPKY